MSVFCQLYFSQFYLFVKKIKLSLPHHIYMYNTRTKKGDFQEALANLE